MSTAEHFTSHHQLWFWVFTSILITSFHSHHRLCLSVFPEEVHHVSVSINVSHSLLVCGEAWGTEPHFSWLHERVAITKNVGQVSKDGTALLVTMVPLCGHFTCMVSNKRSYSSATYTAGLSWLLVVFLWLCMKPLILFLEICDLSTAVNLTYVALFNISMLDKIDNMIRLTHLPYQLFWW